MAIIFITIGAQIFIVEVCACPHAFVTLDTAVVIRTLHLILCPLSRKSVHPFPVLVLYPLSLDTSHSVRQLLSFLLRIHICKPV
jgi:hypothetical protein